MMQFLADSFDLPIWGIENEICAHSKLLHLMLTVFETKLSFHTKTAFYKDFFSREIRLCAQQTFD